MNPNRAFPLLGILVALLSVLSAAFAAPSPQIGISVTYPTENLSVNQGLFFHVTTNVSCSVTNCEDIEVSLDPYPPECTNYTEIDWDGNSIYDPYTTGKCSNTLTPGWYRLNGTYDAIPVQRSYIDLICNTHAPGFLNFSYPTSPGGTTSGNICYHWSGNTCNWYSTGIKVTNCAGYYVYYLTPSPTCTLHPCTTDEIPPPPQEKFGLISETPGTQPFYTNGSNPATINLNAGQSQLVTFWVNATGTPWDYEFFAYANRSASPSSVNNRTGNFSVLIVPPPGVAFVNLPAFSQSTGGEAEVQIELSADNFLGGPDSPTLDSMWWNDGSDDHPYSSPVMHTFSDGDYVLTAYAEDTDGKIYSSVHLLGVGSVACGDVITDDVTLTSDLDCSGYDGDAITIQGNNVNLDCDGHSIIGSGDESGYTGVHVDHSDGVTVENCVITDFEDGIYMDYSNEGRILGNTLDNNYYGLDMYYADFNSVLENRFNWNVIGFYLYQSDSNQIGRNIVRDTEDGNFGSGSCPFLYLWQGTGYEYYTDLAGESLGGSWFETPLYEAGIYELGDFRATDGVYRMKVREVIPESDFFDEAKLAIVDVPEGYGVLNQWHNTYSDDKAPPKGFMTIKDPKAPISATDRHGNDVLSEISERDGAPLPTRNGEPNSVIVDFGSIGHPEHAKLVITGWSSYEDNPGLGSQKNLLIETTGESGEWAEAKRFGKFTGDSRTFVFDISGIVGADDTRMRITAPYSKTTINVIDQVLLDDSEPADVEVAYVDPDVAELRHGGAATYEYATTEHRHIVSDDVLPDVEGDLMYGNFTKYGDVGPLLESADDKFAIMRHGDELELQFSDIPRREGMDRYVFLKADVMYAIKYSVKGFVSDSIEPMPFHGMSAYPYPEGESYPYDAEHLAYIGEWNTRAYEKPGKFGGSLPYSFNNTVFENTITGGEHSTGLYLEYEESTSLLNNRISGVMTGIDLYESDDSLIRGNIISSETGRGLIMRQESDDNVVEFNTIRSDSSENCYYDNCGAVFIGKSEDNVLRFNTLEATEGYGIYLGYSYWTTVTDNTIAASGDDYFGIFLTKDSEDNLFLRNSITSDFWVGDHVGGNDFSDDDYGNKYFDSEGTGAWELFDIIDTDGDRWADDGADLPFNSDLGYTFWEGLGEDWHPYVAAESAGDDDGGTTPALSLEFDSGCEGNVVTVDGAGDGASVVVKDSAGNILASGRTESDEFVFQGCGLEGISIKATMSGHLPGTLGGRDTVSCEECGIENASPAGCAADGDCAINERCLDGDCVQVPCPCGQVQNHQCMPYECCADPDCAADETCESHSCVKKPDEGCKADGECPPAQYCDVPPGAASGSCKDVTGQCGYVENHVFVPYGYECGSEEGCPACSEGFACVDHGCVQNDVSCPTTGIVGDSKTCEVKYDGEPCTGCEYVVTDPSGKNTTGRTDENGNFALPLGSEGTYKVALIRDGQVVKVIEVKAFPQAAPEEGAQPEKPAAEGDDAGMTALLALVVIAAIAVGAFYMMRGKGKK